MYSVLVIIMLVASGILQVVAIANIFGLRRALNKIPHLSEQPKVRRWMRWCRAAWLAAVFAALIAPVILQENGLIITAIGLGGPTILMITAAVASDNSTDHGSGDSDG